jgi:hypothetical protein
MPEAGASRTPGRWCCSAVPELHRPLLKLSELAEPGCEHVFARHRVRSANLRTMFEKIIARAGLRP